MAGLRGRGTRRRRPQEVLGGLARDHAISNRVGVLLVRVADLTDAAFQVNAGALLHDVRGFVRGRVKPGDGAATRARS